MSLSCDCSFDYDGDGWYWVGHKLMTMPAHATATNDAVVAIT